MVFQLGTLRHLPRWLSKGNKNVSSMSVSTHLDCPISAHTRPIILRGSLDTFTGREVSHQPCVLPISVPGFMHATNQRTAREELSPLSLWGSLGVLVNSDKSEFRSRLYRCFILMKMAGLLQALIVISREKLATNKLLITSVYKRWQHQEPTRTMDLFPGKSLRK